MTILAGQNVSKRFGGLQAVAGVSFNLAEGEILGLIGPNGAGKTTLFNLLIGLVRPDEGSIKLEGAEIARKKPHQVARLGMTKTFQNVALFSDETVLDNVLTAGLLKHGVAAARDLARGSLERVGLGGAAETRAGELSFPERARVELARALCTEPKVLLLDEVMASLNPVEMAGIIGLIRQLREEGLTILLVEHHMKAVMAVCDRILVLNFGRLIASGSPREIASDPAVIEAYLGRAYEAA